MLPYLWDVRVGVVAALVGAKSWVRGVGYKLKDSNGANGSVALLHVLFQRCLEQRLPTLLAHLLGGARRIIVDALEVVLEGRLVAEMKIGEKKTSC